MIHRPVCEYSLAVDKLSRHRPENPRVVRAGAVIPHYEILALRNLRGRVRPEIIGLGRNIRFRQEFPVQINLPLANFNRILWQPDDALDERLRAVQRIPENDDIAALNRIESVNEFVDENPLLIGDQGSHAGAFDFYRLVEENDNNNSEAERNDEIAPPTSKLAPQRLRRSGRDSRADFGVRLHVLTFEQLNLYHAPLSSATVTANGFCPALKASISFLYSGVRGFNPDARVRVLSGFSH